ncbi:MAG TPA: PIG-L family deacetylase [Ktedonobacteraceae bacterium]|nr:PIG-L family deacetylase [Ktedonobacteraceae bacterium]
MQLKSFDEITRDHRHIFLSPHLDDVVYSCGGTLGVQVSTGLRPLVITIFAGVPSSNTELSPFAVEVQRGMDFRQNAQTAMTTRREEDTRALDYLHADYLWLDYLDAIYRGTPAYYSQNSQLIGGDVHPADLWIDKELAQNLVTLHERLPDAVWYAPLGVGRHVDHQIVCSAVDRLIQRGANVKLYEDFPYVLTKDALENRLQEFGGTMEPALVEMSEMLHLRLEGSEMYSSQIQLNFPDKASMHQSMEDYSHGIRPVQTVHLERYWTAR